MRVIDFRARPNLPEYASYLRPRLEAIAVDTGGSFGDYAAPDETVEGFLGQLDECGIARAVLVARSRVAAGSWALTNDFLASKLSAYSDRITVFGGLDLTDPIEAVEEAGRCVDDFGFPGVSIDPFQVDAAADDERLDPIYEFCEKRGVAVAVTLGGMPGIAASLRTGDPVALDDVARRFPELTIIGSHSGWPFTNTMIAVAWRRRNVYFENSFYHSAPGANALVEAANTMIGHKMLYASAYPFSPLKATLESFRRLGFKPDVLQRVLHDNAAGLLARLEAR